MKVQETGTILVNRCISSVSPYRPRSSLQVCSKTHSNNGACFLLLFPLLFFLLTWFKSRLQNNLATPWEGAHASFKLWLPQGLFRALVSCNVCAEAPSRGLHRITGTMKNGEEGGGRERKRKAEPLLHHVERRTNQTQSALRVGSERGRVMLSQIMLWCPNTLIQSSGLPAGNTTFRYWLLYTVGFC